MPRKSGQNSNKSRSGTRPAGSATVLRIIGGRHRGRQLSYSGDKVTRPMKDDVRESLFNLVGGWVPGRWAVDLFAGTGAVGLEALSRGATHATLVERHFPTARIIRENVKTLEEGEHVTVVTSDAFFWTRQFLKRPEAPVEGPWAVFCCPPWPMFQHQKPALLQLISDWFQLLPPDSLLIVESDDRFNPAELPEPDRWVSRDYPPARISVFRPAGENNAENLGTFAEWDPEGDNS